MTHWRSQNSRYEVDLILDRESAIEFKSGGSFREDWLKGLKALKSEKVIKNFYCVSNDKVERVIDGIQVIYWEEYLKRLWDGDLMIHSH